MEYLFSKIKRPIDHIPHDVHMAIREVWAMVELNELLKDVESAFFMAITSDEYENMEDRDSFVIFYSKLLPFIELMYFYYRSTDKVMIDHYESMSDERKLTHDNANRKHRISMDQANNPLIDIKAFCKNFSIEYIRIELWQFLDAINSNKYEVVEEPKNHSNIIYMALITLCESGYILLKHTPRIEQDE